MDNKDKSRRTFRALIRQAFSSLGAHTAIYDRDLNLLWSNEAFDAYFGSTGHGPKRKCLDHFHGDEFECPGYLVNLAFESHIPQQAVFKISDDQGPSRYVKSLMLPLMDETDDINHVIEICWDITKDSAHEAVLSVQNTLLDNLANASLDAILIVNNDWEITFWNRGAELLLGYSLEEVIEQNISLIIPDNERAEGELNLLRHLLISRGYVKNYETELFSRGGRTVRVEVTSSYLDNVQREKSGIYLIIRDISARKNLEYIFRNAIEKLSKLHEIADILHRARSEHEIFRNMLVSVTAGEGLRFNRAFLLTVNRNSGMLEGYLAIGPSDPEEAADIWEHLPREYHTLSEILDSMKYETPDESSSVMHLVRELSTPLTDDRNLLARSVNDRRSYLVVDSKTTIEFDPGICSLLGTSWFAVVPIISSEQVIGILIVDNVFNREPITERDVDALEICTAQAALALENVQLQEKLSLRLEELEKAYSNLQDSQNKLVRAERLATVGEVVTKVSHEIRNPLVNIGGFSARLLNKSKAGTEEHQYLEIISTEARRLEKILDNILNYSSIFEPSRELVNMKDLINKNLLMVMDDLQSHSISIHYEIDKADILLNIDPYQITQVFLNIVRNAIQAMPKGGALEVHTDREDNTLIIRVKDTGGGIRKRDMDKLFQPFYTTKSRGLGLGLPIAQQIMNLHGGSISISSEHGSGSELSIRLPIV